MLALTLMPPEELRIIPTFQAVGDLVGVPNCITGLFIPLTFLKDILLPLSVTNIAALVR